MFDQPYLNSDSNLSSTTFLENGITIRRLQNAVTQERASRTIILRSFHVDIVYKIGLNRKKFGQILSKEASKSWNKVKIRFFVKI